MAKYCPQCNNENPSGADFCMVCGVLLNKELPQCPKCKEKYTKAADFCLHCGTALTDNAIEIQKNEEHRQIQKLKNDIKTFNRKLTEEQEIKNEIEIRLQKGIKALQNKNIELCAEKKEIEKKNGQLEKKLATIKETKQLQTMPKWFYIVALLFISISIAVLIMIIVGTL